MPRGIRHESCSASRKRAKLPPDIVARLNRGFSLTGRLCHAGHRYFIVAPKGNARTCCPGKRYGDGLLGNIFDGRFALRDGPQPRPYAVCPRTVPQNRGIVSTASRVT